MEHPSDWTLRLCRYCGQVVTVTTPTGLTDHYLDDHRDRFITDLQQHARQP